MKEELYTEIFTTDHRPVLYQDLKVNTVRHTPKTFRRQHKEGLHMKMFDIDSSKYFSDVCTNDKLRSKLNIWGD